MKSLPTSRTGLCFICGKSTKLLIHGECGKVADAMKNQKKKDRQHNATKKAYAAGSMPWFTKL